MIIWENTYKALNIVACMESLKVLDIAFSFFLVSLD